MYQALVTGTYYDIANQAKAEQRLGYLESKLKRDSERGNRAAMDRDIRQIERDKYRIAVDVWLIRQNSQRDPGYYPVRTDEISCAALAQVATPPQFPVYSQLYPLPTSTPAPALTPPPAAAVLMIPITIVNAEPLGDGIAFAIDNVSYLAASNSRQDLSVAANSSITYDAGGSLGQQKYQIVPGIYEVPFHPQRLGTL